LAPNTISPEEVVDELEANTLPKINALTRDLKPLTVFKQLSNEFLNG